jgi:hypothetical protein
MGAFSMSRYDSGDLRRVSPGMRTTTLVRPEEEEDGISPALTAGARLGGLVHVLSDQALRGGGGLQGTISESDAMRL